MSTTTATPLNPDAVIVRMPEAIGITGLSRSSIYRRMNDDTTFPKPVPLSDSDARSAPIGFVLSELQGWVEKRKEARGKDAA